MIMQSDCAEVALDSISSISSIPGTFFSLFFCKTPFAPFAKLD